MGERLTVRVEDMVGSRAMASAGVWDRLELMHRCACSFRPRFRLGLCTDCGSG